MDLTLARMNVRGNGMDNDWLNKWGSKNNGYERLENERAQSPSV